MLVLTAILALSALAQDLAPGAAPAAPPPPPLAAVPAPSATPEGLARAGTTLEVELVNTLSSADSTLGQRFPIRLAAPIVVNGVEVAPAGAMGEGEVIDVGRSGMSGKQGKLIVAARFLELNGRQVRVRGMTLMASGRSRVDLATGVAIVAGLPAMMITGGEIYIPGGTRANVRLGEDVQFQTNTNKTGGIIQ